MSAKETKTKINTEENEKLKTQIDASIGIARSLINSWLPPPKEGEKLEDDEDDLTMSKYSTGRPDRLGLGAKFLSHNDAMRHNTNTNGGMASKEELQLKNKILNQNRRAAMHREANTPTPVGKRFRPQDNNNDSDSDNEEESRSTTVGTKGAAKNNKKKKGNNSSNTTTPAKAAGGTKKIGNQGDFLSMYLSERAGKKKNKK